MKRLLLVFMFLSSFLFAKYEIGDKIAPFEVSDQFDAPLSIESDTKYILYTSSKASGKIAGEFFENRPDGYLKEKGILYIANMSSVPKFVLDFFMMRGFKKYNYSLGILKDKELGENFIHKDEEVTLYKIRDFMIVDISHTKSAQELESLID